MCPMGICLSVGECMEHEPYNEGMPKSAEPCILSDRQNASEIPIVIKQKRIIKCARWELNPHLKTSEIFALSC